MKFLILTQYYPPETGAPQNRLSDLANRLHQFGHEVSVLTSLPNYPVGKIFPEYRGYLYKQVNLLGINIFHCWIFPSRSKSTLLRLLNYFSFVFSSIIFGTFLLPKVDFIFVESPPIFLGLSAWWLSKIKGAKIIFNVSDLYPETAIALGYLDNHYLQNILYKFEAWCYSVSFLITGQTKGIIQSIKLRFPHQSTYWLTNGVDLSRFAFGSNNEAHTVEDKEHFTIGYAGILGHAQNLKSVLRVAMRLKTLAPHVQFALYGDGPLREELIKEMEEMNLDNVRMFGHLPHNEVIKIILAWDAGIVPLVNSSLMAGAVPSKMFEVMASNCPVILYTPEGEASDIIMAANAGVWVCADQEELLAETIVQLAKSNTKCKELGNNGRQYIMEHFERAKIAKKFVNEITRLNTSNHPNVLQAKV